jgi:hypothetical protein
MARPVFECWNDNGYRQIDSLYPNLRLVAKGSVSCDQAYPTDVHNNFKFRDISVAASNPIIAFRSFADCASCGVGFDGNTYNHRFFTRGVANVDYWCFADTPAPINVGLEVFRDDGTLIFTSKDQPAKVVGNSNVASGSPYSQGTDAQQLAVVANSATFTLRGVFFGTSTKYGSVSAYTARMLGGGGVAWGFSEIYMALPQYNGNTLDAATQNYTLLDTYGQ